MKQLGIRLGLNVTIYNEYIFYAKNSNANNSDLDVNVQFRCKKKEAIK